VDGVAAATVPLIGTPVEETVTAALDSLTREARETYQAVSESLPLNVGKLERSMQQYLNSLEELDGEMVQLFSMSNMPYCLAAVALGVVAFEVARRRLTRSGREPVLTLDVGDTRSDWFLGLQMD